MTMQPLTDIESINDYGELVETLGYTIVENCEEGDYSGENIWLLRGDQSERRLSYPQYGYLNYSYGSCTGCDEFLACSTLEDYETLRQNMDKAIRWGTAEELLKWLEEHDWGGDYTNYYKSWFDLVIELFKAHLRVVIVEAKKR